MRPGRSVAFRTFGMARMRGQTFSPALRHWLPSCRPKCPCQNSRLDILGVSVKQAKLRFYKCLSQTQTHGFFSSKLHKRVEIAKSSLISYRFPVGKTRMVANPSARRRHRQASNRNTLPGIDTRGSGERGPKLNRITFWGSRGWQKFVCFDFFDKQDLRGVDLSPVLPLDLG